MLANLTSMMHFPDEEDLNGMAIGLMRLQDTYKLETSQLAKGNILGVKSAYRELTGELISLNFKGITSFFDFEWIYFLVGGAFQSPNVSILYTWCKIIHYLNFSIDFNNELITDLNFLFLFVAM